MHAVDVIERRRRRRCAALRRRNMHLKKFTTHTWSSVNARIAFILLLLLSLTVVVVPIRYTYVTVNCFREAHKRIKGEWLTKKVTSLLYLFFLFFVVLFPSLLRHFCRLVPI